MGNQKKISYWLDHNNCVAGVSYGWDDFAYANKGEAAASGNIIGRPLREFISGDATWHWILSNLELSRLHNQRVERLCRCDSPTEKRFLQMRIMPESSGIIRVTHTVLKTEPLPAPLEFQTMLFSHKSYLRRCSNCLRLLVGEKWVEVDDVYETTDLLEGLHALPVIYDICQQCAT